MNPNDLFPVGASVSFYKYCISGHVIGHRMTRVVVHTTMPLPNLMPIGTLVLDDFTVAANPTLLRQSHE